MKVKTITSISVLALAVGLIATLGITSYAQDDDDKDVMQNEQHEGMMMQQQDMDGAMADDEMKERMMRERGMGRGMGGGMMGGDGMMMHHRGMMDKGMMGKGMMDKGMMDGKMMGMCDRGMMKKGMWFMWHLRVASQLMDLVDQYADIADDSDRAAVAAILGADHYFKNNEDYIAFLEKNLSSSDNNTIRRAIQMKLAELYGKSSDEATRAKSLDMLQNLIDNK
ncbi:hypothetical protein JD969_01915 [Planctomycetota bacterium]|nr:hypothetical protein JD969_01915 [Planctomycetota bacterium]